MSRNAGDIGRRHYDVLVRACSTSGERSVATHQAWADVARRARLDHTVGWRVIPCGPGCRL